MIDSVKFKSIIILYSCLAITLFSCENNEELIVDYNGEIKIGKTFKIGDEFHTIRRDSLDRIIDTIPLSELNLIRFEKKKNNTFSKQFLLSYNNVDTLNQINYEGENNRHEINNTTFFDFIPASHNDSLYIHIFSLNISNYAKQVHLYGEDLSTHEEVFISYGNVDSTYNIFEINIDDQVTRFSQFHLCLFYFDLSKDIDSEPKFHSCQPFMFTWK